MNICLLIFNHRGHFTHFAHLEWQALCKCGEVTIVGPTASLDSEEFLSSFSSDDVRKEYFVGTEAQAVCQFARSGKYQLLFSNGLDAYWHKLLPKLLWWKLTGQLKSLISGILLSVPFVYPENHNSSHKFVRTFLLKHLTSWVYHRIYIIDEIAYELLFKRSCKQQVHLLPDPIEKPSCSTKEELRNKFGWSVGENILLAIGVIIPEKRLDLLVKAFVNSTPQPNWKLILAGRFTPEVYKELKGLLSESNYGKQVLLINRWLDDSEINEMIQAADFISVTYSNHFSNASILFRAIQSGKNALVSDSGWIGRYSQRYGYGVQVTLNTHESYVEGIRRIFSMQYFNLPIWEPKEHSEETFMETIQRDYCY